MGTLPGHVYYLTIWLELDSYRPAFTISSKMGVVVSLAFLVINQCLAGPAPDTFYHHYRSPSVSWSVVSSGSPLPSSFKSFINQKAAPSTLQNIFPRQPLIQPFSFQFPLLPPSPWNILDRRSGNGNPQKTEKNRRPFNSILDSLLQTSSSVLGSIVNQFSTGFEGMTRNPVKLPVEYLPVEDAVDINNRNPQKFHLINNDEAFDLGDVFSSIFDDISEDSKESDQVQDIDIDEETLDDLIDNIYKDHLEFIDDFKDTSEGLNLDDGNILDIIDEKNLDDILNEDEKDILESAKNDRFYETLNTVVNPRDFLDQLEEYDVEIQSEDSLDDENLLIDVHEDLEAEAKIDTQSEMLDVQELMKEVVDGNVFTNEV